MNTIIKGKQTAIISYLTLVGSVIAIFMNQDENRSNFASFHIRQALGIFSTFFYWATPLAILTIGWFRHRFGFSFLSCGCMVLSIA